MSLGLTIHVDKEGGRGIKNGSYRRVSYTGVPLANVLCKSVTWLKFLDTYMVQECNCVVQDT